MAPAASALAACLWLVAGASAFADAPALGTPFPGAVIRRQVSDTPCSRRYDFDAPAGASAVARFYLDEGRAAQLDLVSDATSRDAAIRTILMSRKGGGLLFTQIEPTHGGSKGVVYQRAAACG